MAKNVLITEAAGCKDTMPRNDGLFENNTVGHEPVHRTPTRKSVAALQKTYGADFYDEQRDTSLRSAEVIVPLILDVFPADSVVDIGCGTGSWLSAYKKNAVRDIRGFDVSDLPGENYYIDKSLITTGFDLSNEKAFIGCRADVVICLEVAEHLPEASAGTLVKNLVGIAPVVIFSAAFPGQTGVNHINEQPLWYWREKFNHLGYVEIDFIRPLIWYDRRVSWWYRQNITSYVDPACLKNNPKAQALYSRYSNLEEPQRLTVVAEHILRRMLEWKIKLTAAPAAPQSADESANTNLTAALEKSRAALEEGNYHLALQCMEKLLVLKPVPKYLQYFRAVCLEKLGLHRQAYAAAKAELGDNPGHRGSIELMERVKSSLCRQNFPPAPVHISCHQGQVT